MKRNLDDEITILENERWRKIKALLKGAVLEKDQKVSGLALSKGQKLTEKILDEIDPDDARQAQDRADEDRDENIKDIEKKAKRQIEALRAIFKEKVDSLKKGDELAPGVIQAIKVFIAMKRKLSVGDKVSGRHGNKGIIAKIVPEEDMPRLPGRHAGRDRPQSAGRPLPYERRPDPRDARGLGGREARPVDLHAGLRRLLGTRSQGPSERAGLPGIRKNAAFRRDHGRAVSTRK